MRALDIDRPKAQDEEPLTIRAILSALKAPQAWFMFLQFFSSGCMLFSIAYCECIDSSPPIAHLYEARQAARKGVTRARLGWRGESGGAAGRQKW